MNRIELKTDYKSIQVMYLPLSSFVDELSSYDHMLPEHMKDNNQGSKQSFIAGRLCAQFNLDKIENILRGTRGEPLWPKGMVGSISHSKDYAIAAVSNDTQIKSIGIDIEKYLDQKRVDTVIKRKVLTNTEVDLLDSFKKEEQLKMATIMFSAKETLYKLISPLSNSYIAFSEAIFESYDSKSGDYNIKLISDKTELKEYQAVYRGKVYSIDDNIITLSFLEGSPKTQS